MKTFLLKNLVTGKGKSSGSLRGFGMMVVLLMTSMVSSGQVLWSSSGGSAWLTASNWTGGSVPTSAQIAQFGANPTPGTLAGINIAGTQQVGAVEVTSSRLIALTIGNSGGSKAGIIQLNGATVNSQSNVILRNASSSLLTMADLAGGTASTLGVALGNATANNVFIDGTGGITISSIVSGSGRTLTKAGTGAGVFQLTGANTYTGLTTVSGGTMQLNRTLGTTLPTGNSIVVNSGATMIISTPQQLNNVTVDAGGTLELAATLTVTGTATINGTLRIANGGSANGAGTYTYGSTGTLEYKLITGAGTYVVDAGHLYWPTSNGPANVTVNCSGGAVVQMNVGRTVPSSGTTGTFLLVAGANCITGTALTLNGTVQINGGNFSSTPTYGSASTLIYNGSYTTSNEWTGGNSTTVAAGSGVPANVTVQAGTLSLAGARGVPGNVTVNTGTTLVLNSGASNDLYLGGNFAMSGTLTNNTKAVFFVKGAAQSITSSLASVTFDFMIVNKTGGTSVTLGVPVIVNSTLTLTAGYVDLSTFNMTVGATASASSTSYVKTSSSGQLKQTVVGSAKIFPVGTSAYNPITLTNSGTSDAYGIIEVDGALPNANDATLTVDRRWVVTEGTPGGGNLSVVAQYNTGEEEVNYTSGTTPYLGIYTGTWTAVGATLAGSNPFTATSISNFSNSISGSSSYFAVGKDTGLIGGIVPPVITSFSASPNDGTATNGYVGSTVTITGSGFTGVTILKYNGSGGTSISTFTVVNNTTITFAAPAGMFGTIYVENTSGNATSSSSFTNLGYITATTGTWQTAGTWLGASVPPSATTTNITLAHNVTGTTGTIDVGKLTIGSGITLTNTAAATINVNTASTNSGTITTNGTFATAVSYANSGTLTVGSGGTFQLNQGGFLSGTAISYNATASSLTYNNSSGQYGTNNSHAYWPASNGPVTVNVNGAGGVQLQSGAARTVSNLNLAAAFDLQAANLLTVTGALTINSGGSVTSNAPVYGSSSTLVYNTTSNPYNVGTEWTASATTAGAGVPNNVTIQNTNNVTMPNSTRGMAGNLQILATATLTLNGTSGDLDVAGNWTRASTASFNCNGRAVFFNGSTTQTVTVSATGTETFNYLLVQGSGTLKLATGTNIAVTSAGGLSLSSSNATSTVDLNGQTMTLSGGGNLDLNGGARKITSTLSGGVFKITTAVTTVTNGGSLSFAATNTTVNLLNGMNFGSGLTTINGNLQIDGGGYTQTNSPIYGNTSTLIYNSVTSYGVNGEWTGNATTAGTGIPQNVTLTSSSVNMPASARGLAGNLTIASGSTLTLNGTSGADLSIAGNWSNAGTFTPASRLVTFNGGTAQTLTGATTFDYLTLNNSNGLTLQPSSAVTVNQTLALTSGKITLGANNLTVGSTGSITGGSATNYIVTNGAGQLKRTVPNSATLFPVGNAAYNPISFDNSGTSDVYGVVVADGAVTAALDATKTVSRRWIVTEAVSGGSNLAVVAQYNTGEPNTNYNAGTNPFIGFYNGTSWIQAAATLAGSNPFTSTSGANLSPANLTTGTQYFAAGKDNAFISTATTLVVTAISPTSPTAGSGFSVTVRSQDAYGLFSNVVANTAFSLTTNGNAGAIGGTLTGTITAGTSTVTVTGVTLASAGTGVTVTATRTSGDVLSLGTSSTFTVLAAASQLVLVSVPSTGTVGSNLASFTVEARRPDNSLDNTFTQSITLTKASGPGSISGTTSASAVAGVATFSAVQFTSNGTVTLTASSGLLTPATSGNIVISLVPASIFANVITASNPSTSNPYTTGQTFDSKLTVSGIGRGSGITANAGSNRYNATSWTTGATIDANDYFDFTLTPAAGYEILFGSFVYSATSSASGPTLVAFRSSVDGYTANIGSPTATASNLSLSLSGAAYQNIDSAISFRYYGYASGTGTASIDDFIFNGNVVCIDPIAYTVTGTATTCAGTGVPVGLSDSQNGINYQLKLNGSTNVGSPVAGTGSAISFGNQVTAGTYTVVATNTNSPCNFTETMSGSAVITYNTTTAWVGNTSTDWATASNWSCGVPFAGSNVTINSGGSFQPVIASDISIASLTLNAALVVPSNYDLTVANAITNNSTLTVQNNANVIQTHTGSNANSGSGTVTVNRDSNALNRLDYTMWSSPVTGQNLLAFSPLTSNTGPTNIRFYTYNWTLDRYDAVTSAGTTDFAPATGYLIRMPNNSPDVPATPVVYPGVFTGEIHNGPISLSSLTNGLYYGTGNPYPSTIDADAFITANSLTDALYFWRKINAASGSAYATYTLAGGASPSPGTGASPSSAIPNGTIQVGQGFIAKAASGALSFTNAMRTGNNVGQFFRNAQDRSRVWLNLTNTNGFFSQTMIAYMTGATTGVDAAIDGKYFNDSQTALTSVINGGEYAVQGRPVPFEVTDVVPLGFKSATAGNYTISINSVDGLFETANQTIYLKDNLTATTTNLSAGNYNFSTASGVFNNRFEIVYEAPLATIQPVFDANNVILYKQNNNLVINTGKSVMATVKIYDIRGRLLIEKNNINASETRIETDNTDQVLIVKITSDNEVTVTKKVVN